MAELGNPTKNNGNAAKPAVDSDVIIVGAGPAGMSAAVEIASAGRSVIVLDMQPAPGGQVFRGLEANLKDRPSTDRLLNALGPTYFAGQSLIARFRSTSGIDYRPDTIVWELRADGTVGWLKGGNAGYLRARHVLIANGAMERPVPFPGWTLPGVMTAGALQTLIKEGRLQPEGRIVLVGTGPLMFLLADQLRRLGVDPALIARTDRLYDKMTALPRLRLPFVPDMLKGLGWIFRLRMAGVSMRSGISGLQAVGQERIEAVSVLVGGKREEFSCDLLVVHDGIIPSVDLAHCAGLAMEWHNADASWRPITSPDGRAQIAEGDSMNSGPCRTYISGDARRIGGAKAACAHGRYAAKAVLSDLKNGANLGLSTCDEPTVVAVRRSMAGRPFVDTAFPPGLAAQLPADATIICRCEEVTAGSLRAAIRRGAKDVNLLRGLLRCGMGPCQGRNCSVTVARLLAEELATTPGVAQPVTFRARPPLRPLPLGALATMSGLDPDLAQIESLEDKPAAVNSDAHA